MTPEQKTSALAKASSININDMVSSSSNKLLWSLSPCSHDLMWLFDGCCDNSFYVKVDDRWHKFICGIASDGILFRRVRGNPDGNSMIIVIDENATNTNSIKETKLVKKTEESLKLSLKKNNKKFKIGEEYRLRNKSVFSMKEKRYICKKVVYKMSDEPVEIVVMKCIDVVLDEDVYTLSKNDCKKIHLKYEPGLQVFSMKENFLPKRR